MLITSCALLLITSWRPEIKRRTASKLNEIGGASRRCQPRDHLPSTDPALRRPLNASVALLGPPLPFTEP